MANDVPETLRFRTTQFEKRGFNPTNDIAWTMYEIPNSFAINNGIQIHKT
jgi:hypothetical protein